MISSMFTVIYIEFFSLHRIDLKLTTLFIYGLFQIFFLTAQIKIYIMRMLFTTQDRRWPAGKTACEDLSL